MNEKLFNDVQSTRDALREAKKNGRLHECWDQHDAFVALMEQATNVAIATRDRSLLSLSESLNRHLADLVVEVLRHDELMLRNKWGEYPTCAHG